jgi:parvulin-like peptidyl-prolyl isomerase
MESCLEVKDTQIFSNLSIDRLQNWESLPELFRKIAIEDTIEQVADRESIDLNYTSEEFAELLIEIKQLSAFEGMNPSQLSAITERELKLQKFKLGKWGNRVETYFKSQESGLDSIVISILQVADVALAQELFFRIESGEQSFAEIAMDYSQGKYVENGGIVGPLLLRELAPPIADIVTQLQPGQLSSLFEIDGYYTLFRLDELSPAQLDKRTEIFLLDELFTVWVNTEIAMPSANSAIVTDRIVYYLSRSELLTSYFQHLIIEETLARWETASEPVALSTDIYPHQHRAALLQQYKLSKWKHLLKSQFLQFKQQIDRVLFSIVQVADLSLAQELYYQIGEQKRSFHKLATAYSKHPTATGGGIVGPICLSQLNPIITQHITGIASKQLSGIFKLDEDYVFIRVERWLPAQYNEQIEQLLLDRLFAQWLQQQLRDRLNNMHSISFSPVIDLIKSYNTNDRHIAISVEPEPEPEPTKTLSPTSSFFFPQVSPSGNILPTTQFSDEDRRAPATTTSFFFPQPESPTQFISEPNRRQTSVLVDRIIAFAAFFCLFLAGEIGLVHWLKTVDVDRINHAASSNYDI